eukprot:47360_1
MAAASTMLPQSASLPSGHTLEDVFPSAEIFCLPLYVDFLIHTAVIFVAVLIHQLAFFRIKSERWYILHHYNNLNALPLEIKMRILQYHTEEHLQIIDELLLFVPHRDIVQLIYSYIELRRASGICSVTSSSSSIELEIQKYGETETLKQMEDVVNGTMHDDDLPIWADKDYINRLLSDYINRIVLRSSIYSIMVIACECVTILIVIIEFIRWARVADLDSKWNYYNGWCICTALIQPFLRYYKFLFFYTMDFGDTYYPHNVEWKTIMMITNNKYRNIARKVNVFQIILSVVCGIMWIPLLPGAILLILAIFCFIIAVGVPFYIVCALLEYLNECYFYKIKCCGVFLKTMQQIAIHLMILIVLSSIHFCLYSSILSTSVSLYGAKDVVGCLNYEWDWTIHHWQWTNIFIILSWVLV